MRTSCYKDQVIPILSVGTSCDPPKPHMKENNICCIWLFGYPVRVKSMRGVHFRRNFLNIFKNVDFSSQRKITVYRYRYLLRGLPSKLASFLYRVSEFYSAYVNISYTDSDRDVVHSERFALIENI